MHDSNFQNLVLHNACGHTPRYIYLSLFLLISITLIGCSNYVSRPMSSSLTALTSETSTTNTKLLNYSEVLSVAGLLPMPDVGVLYYQPEPFWWDKLFDNEVGAFKSVGIARYPSKRKSFRIIGEMTEFPTYDQVIEAVIAIDNLSDASAEGVSNLIKQSAIKQQIETLNEEKIKFGDPNYSPDKYNRSIWDSWDKQKLSAETKIKLLETKISDLESEQDEINKLVIQGHDEIENLKKLAKQKTKHKGLIIATWDTQSSNGASASVGNSSDEDNIEDSDEINNVASIAAAASKGQSGLAVLGGLKVSSLFVAEDYMKMLASTESDGYRALLAEVGATTSVMQTKYVSYSSNINIANSINIEAQIKASSLYGISPNSILQGLDTAKLSAYLTNVSNLSNKGNIGEVRWYRDEIDFEKCGKDETSNNCEFSSMDRYKPYNSSFNNETEQTENPEIPTKGKPIPSEYDHWITLQSVQARLDSNVLDALLLVYQKEKDLEECSWCIDQESMDRCIDNVHIKYSDNVANDDY